MKLLLTSLPVGTRVRTNSVTSMGMGVDGYWLTGTLAEKWGSVAIVQHDNGSRVMLAAGSILKPLPPLADARPVVGPLFATTHARVDFVETETRAWDHKPGPRLYVGCTCGFARELDADTWQAERADEAHINEHYGDVVYRS